MPLSLSPLIAALVIFLAGCPAQKHMEVPPSAVLPSEPPYEMSSPKTGPQLQGTSSATLRPDGSPCFTSSQCSSTICEGAQCDGETPGTCVPEERSCSEKSVEFCGCDGVTFLASATCPEEAYRSKGKCPNADTEIEPFPEN